MYTAHSSCNINIHIRHTRCTLDRLFQPPLLPSLYHFTCVCELTLCRQLTLYTHGFDLMLHSKYTSAPSRMVDVELRLLPSSSVTTGTSTTDRKKRVNVKTRWNTVKMELSVYTRVLMEFYRRGDVACTCTIEHNTETLVHMGS